VPSAEEGVRNRSKWNGPDRPLLVGHRPRRSCRAGGWDEVDPLRPIRGRDSDGRGGRGFSPRVARNRSRPARAAGRSSRPKTRFGSDCPDIRTAKPGRKEDPLGSSPGGWRNRRSTRRPGVAGNPIEPAPRGGPRRIGRRGVREEPRRGSRGSSSRMWREAGRRTATRARRPISARISDGGRRTDRRVVLETRRSGPRNRAVAGSRASRSGSPAIAKDFEHDAERESRRSKRVPRRRSVGRPRRARGSGRTSVRQEVDPAAGRASAVRARPTRRGSEASPVGLWADFTTTKARLRPEAGDEPLRIERPSVRPHGARGA